MVAQLELKVDSSPSNSLALTNQVFLNPADANVFMASAPAESIAKERYYVQLRDQVYTCRPHDKVVAGAIGLSSVQRMNINVAINEKILVTLYTPETSDVFLGQLRLEVDFLAKNKKPNDRFEVDDLKKNIISQLESQIFTVGQKFVLDIKGTNLVFKVLDAQVLVVSAAKSDSGVDPLAKADKGILVAQTDITFEKAAGSSLLLNGGGGSSGAPKLFKPGWKFEGMGIGGLDKEFADIFRRAFASRIFPPSVVQKLGIQHVKGILLYGPPGTGKTLLARQIGKMLNESKEPKIVSGPEILNKYVGASEENIRNLFKDAEAEYKQRATTATCTSSSSMSLMPSAERAAHAMTALVWVILL